MGETVVEMGKRIRELREQLGLSQRHLADMLGTPPPNVSFYEKGTRTASFDTVVKLAKILGTTTDFLLGASRESKELFVDAEVAQAFDDFKELGVRDRKLIVKLIRLIREENSAPTPPAE